MSSVAPPAPPTTHGDLMPAKARKLDQLISWWTIPVFYNIFGLIFVVLTQVMPPPRPDITQAQMVDFFADIRLSIQIGFALLMFFIGFTSVANALIALQIKRMSVSPVFAYGYIVSLAVGALPGCLFAAFAFLAAAFRPDRDPAIIAMLYDLGLLSFVGSLGCFVAQNAVLALAIFLDRNNIFPKWFGYMCIWMIVTELLAGPVFIFRSGPLAWNGSISFYMGTAIYVTWQFCIIRLLYTAIKKQPADEVIQD